MHAFRPASRLKRGIDWYLWTSMAISLLVHAAVWLYATSRPPRPYAFMLVGAGEEALDLDIGGMVESVASRASPEIPEQRMAREREGFAKSRPAAVPVPEPWPSDLKPPPPEPVPERPDRAEPAAEPPSRREYGARRQGDEPEMRNLPLPELAVDPEGWEKRAEDGPREMRFAPVLPDFSEAPENNAPILDDKPPGLPALSDAEERRPKRERLESDAGSPARVRRQRRHEPEERPDSVEPGALRAARNETPAERRSDPSAASEASVDSSVGASRRTRGVWQRVEAESPLMPQYPLGSRRRGEQGLAVVGATIDARGRCVAAELEQSSGFAELDAAALDAVRRAVFRPALLDGVPVQARERFAIEFRLR